MSDEDILFTIAHALRHQSRKVTHQADQLMARVVAERILEAMKRAYVITPKPPAPLWHGLISTRKWVAAGEARGARAIRSRMTWSVGNHPALRNGKRDGLRDALKDGMQDGL